MGDVTKDSRFSHIVNDPRFKSIPRSQRRVKIDKRFQSMFKDQRFKIKYSVDKRGRPISRTSNEDLERYYALSSGSSDSEEEETDRDKPGRFVKNDLKVKKSKSKVKSEKKAPCAESDTDVSDDSTSGSQKSGVGGDEEENVARSDDEDLSEKIKSKLHDMSVDYARGEGALISDSSSDEESSEDDGDETVEHGWGELDKDAERTEEVTPRLAICNMDWDRIRAVDLMVLLNSFTPPGGLVRSVTIYPSEFGLERMKKEDQEGPPELVEQSTKNQTIRSLSNGQDTSDEEEDDDDSNEGADENAAVDENEEGSTYHMEKLRQYQLNRLKYFYAVVECDSASTANHIYTECDGMEYESSATRLDLRFIPDDTTFDQDPREVCKEVPDATKYRPRYFKNSALQQAKVELTWDETDPSRTEIAERLMAGDTVDDNDLQTYLASSSGGEESADEEKKTYSKEKESNGHGKTVEEQENSNGESDEEREDEDPIAKYRSLLSGLADEEEKKKNKDVHMEISWGLGLKEKTEEAVKKRISNSKDLTPFQEMMEKRKQKRLEKKKEKLEKKKSEGNGGDNDETLFSDDDIPSDVDMNDPYFVDAYKDLDTKPKKKKSKKWEDNDETEENKQKKAELELLLLDKDEPKHFNFKRIQEDESSSQSKKKKKAKRKKGKDSTGKESAEDDFKIDVDDKRFAALYSSHHYNLDPTDSHFRKSNAMDALISTKQKRLANSSREVSDHHPSPPPTKKPKKDLELSLLVKSVKSKAQKLKDR